MESQSEPQPIKEKRQLSEKQLEQLAKAREKGNAVRKKNAEMKRKAKQVTQMKQQQEETALDLELASLTKAPLKRARAKKAPQLVAQEDLVSTSSSESSESESEEPDIKPSKPKRRRARVKKVKQALSSDESSDEDCAPPRQRAPGHLGQMTQDAMYDHQMKRAFGSLFPNYNL
jgi:hypothetical protein